MRPLLAIDGESAKWVVFRDAKLPPVAELFVCGAQTHAFVCMGLRRNNAISLRAVFRPLAGMGHALVVSAELVFGTRNVADFDPGAWNPAHQ